MPNDLELYTQPHDTHNALSTLTQEIANLRLELKIQSMMLARIMAQLDPLFVIPEDHPLRRADSDRIGRDVIKKLKAEYRASNPGTPEF